MGDSIHGWYIKRSLQLQLVLMSTQRAKRLKLGNTSSTYVVPLLRLWLCSQVVTMIR